MAVEHGSSTVRTTCDLRNVLNAGDWLRLGTETTLVTSPFTADRLTIVTRYSGTSAAGVKAFKQSRDMPLTGGCVCASTRAVALAGCGAVVIMVVVALSW